MAHEVSYRRFGTHSTGGVGYLFIFPAQSVLSEEPPTESAALLLVDQGSIRQGERAVTGGRDVMIVGD